MQRTNTQEQYVVREEQHGLFGSTKWTVQFSAPTRRRASNFDRNIQSQEHSRETFSPILPVPKTIIELEYDKLVLLDPSIIEHKFNLYFTCNINLTLMFDPVIVIESGQTYDRQSILLWFKTSNKDPNTGIELKSKDLIPNLVLKQQILDCLQTMRESHTEPPAPRPSATLA